MHNREGGATDRGWMISRRWRSDVMCNEYVVDFLWTEYRACQAHDTGAKKRYSSRITSKPVKLLSASRAFIRADEVISGVVIK